MFYSSSVEMPRTSGLMPTIGLCPTMKILPKLASMKCGLPSLSTMEPPTKVPKDYEIFYKRLRQKPMDMKLYEFKTPLYQLNKYLPLLPGPHGYGHDDADMFDTIQECVPDWSNSYIASNTMTKNINDLLEYYGKLEQQGVPVNASKRCLSVIWSIICTPARFSLELL
jgi:hypothetical protein